MIRHSSCQFNDRNTQLSGRKKKSINGWMVLVCIVVVRRISVRSAAMADIVIQPAAPGAPRTEAVVPPKVKIFHIAVNVQHC